MRKKSKRKALLDSKFKEINDVELIEEVRKRTNNKNFNFITQERENDILIDIEVKSMKVNTISPLFTIKKEKKHE